MTTTTHSITRDVTPADNQSSSRSDTSSVAPYPVEFSSDQLVFDDWNHMFLKSLFKGLTARQAESDPSNVLDLGCGSGLWILEAAKAWPKCTFIGMDFRQIQPDLRLCGTQPGLGNISKRVRWVHGDFLQPLPFAPNSFDLVRICGIGLGVPEDKWQDLFQRVSRILVPGGIVEVIEDDLTFPCGSQPEWSPPDPKVATLPPTVSTETILGDSPTGPRSSRLTQKSSSSRLVTPLFPTESLDPHDDPFNLIIGSTRIDYLDILDPKNHSKLKAAWDRMLHKRFLTAGLLSVLQFYFTAEFDEAQTFPTLQIPLPPNTRLYEAEAAAKALPTIVAPDCPLPTILEHPGVVRELGIPALPTLSAEADPVLDGYHRLAESGPSGSVTSSTWAHMHLAKVVSLVQGCKAAIWEEYKDLEPSTTGVWDVQDEFQAAWLNWQCDMRDRMRMRKNMHYSVAWSREAPAEPPDGKAWRSRAGFMEVDEEDPELDLRVGRAVRAFVGRKPFNRDH